MSMTIYSEVERIKQALFTIGDPVDSVIVEEDYSKRSYRIRVKFLIEKSYHFVEHHLDIAQLQLGRFDTILRHLVKEISARIREAINDYCNNQRE